MSAAFHLDVNGQLKFVNPKNDAEVIVLGTAYVARETGLPTGERLAVPVLVDVQTLLTEAKDNAEAAQTNENQRAISATDYTSALEQAKPLLHDALTQLKYKHRQNLAELRNYGLETKIGKHGNVLAPQPKTDAGWVNFLTAYVAQEAALPEAQRITDPALDHLQELADKVQTNLATRESGQMQREIGIENRSDAAAQLLEQLQLAAHVLIVTRYASKITNDLQLWGFNIIEKTTGTQPPPNPVPPPPAN